VKFVLPFFLQVWMFASPVFYPSTWLPENLRPVFALNPVTGLLDGFRHILFGTELNPGTFGISLSVALILFVVSLFVFRKMEDDFADLL
jgi:lipopolysaccharide transport system permease protein